ncbi:hypothetical protein ANANG_G00117370 [Anguilla anguilla]|uniref:Uncharacterized protein n=1 Tax=Anguilla anguilla TaxID=7936 RepID=A0A9D3MCV0_ANGAN|nr:hypothetical protein ANANG_G00117370 [Anguilla anguilla]
MRYCSSEGGKAICEIAGLRRCSLTPFPGTYGHFAHAPVLSQRGNRQDIWLRKSAWSFYANWGSDRINDKKRVYLWLVSQNCIVIYFVWPSICTTNTQLLQYLNSSIKQVLPSLRSFTHTEIVNKHKCSISGAHYENNTKA